MGTRNVVSVLFGVAIILFSSRGFCEDLTKQEIFKRSAQGKMTVRQKTELTKKIVSGEVDALIAVGDQWTDAESRSAYVGFNPATEDDYVILFAYVVAWELKDWSDKRTYGKYLMLSQPHDKVPVKAIIGWYQDIVRSHPNNAYAHFFLGRAYSTFPVSRAGISYEEKYNYAIQQYEEAIKYKEKLGLAYFYLASEYRRRRTVLSVSTPPKIYKVDPEKLIDYYKRAAALDPSLSDDVNRSLGEIYWGSKSYDNALFYLKKILLAKPTDDYVHNEIGNIYSEKGEVKEAIKFLKKALDLNPSPKYYDDLAAAYEEAGNYKAAIGIQQKHLSIYSTESEVDKVKKEIASLEETLTGSKASAKEMEGVWIYTSFESSQKLPNEWETALKEGRFTTTIKGDAFTTKIGGKVVARGTQKLDTSKKPKAIDSAGTKDSRGGQLMLGIYEIDEDTLKICFNTSGSERPSEFNVTAGSAQQMLVIAKRAKR
jgi:uncharacterized protein (TIGR03067 family)